MADDQQRTEPATPRRQEEARQKGQFALSNELSTGLLLLAGVGTLWVTGQGMAGELLATMRDRLLFLPHREWGAAETTVLAQSIGWQLVSLCGAVIGVLMVTALLMGGIQTGFAVTTQPLSPDWGRLSPVKGWNRLFSSRSAVRAVLTMVKVATVAALVVWLFRDRLSDIAWAGRGTLHSTAAAAWRMSLQLALAVAAALVLIGLVDYLFQRWRHDQDLRMSRQDLEDERKQTDGDPQMRARIRKLQRELSRGRMIADVKTASFVVRNPTHYAVALRYDRATMSAPRVVAKGRGFWAKRIIEVAEAHGVPVIERKPLARALYAAVEVGKEIPFEFYQAVVEVLAYLHQLKR